MTSNLPPEAANAERWTDLERARVDVNPDATHWSLVVAAADRQSPEADQALAILCQTYWLPLFQFVRRRCASSQEAEDLTQEFFATLLARNYLAQANPARGRFRSFLFTTLDHFLCNQRDKTFAQKRGGGQRLLSLDRATIEEKACWEPSDTLTPQKIFDREWASALLAEVLRQLREECSVGKRSAQFEQLKGFLSANALPGRYVELAAKLGMNEGAVRIAVHRLRRRYAELLRAEIGRTLADPREIEAELQALFAAFAD